MVAFSEIKRNEMKWAKNERADKWTKAKKKNPARRIRKTMEISNPKINQF